LPRILGDHMVLQRGQPAPVWGTAAPGEGVTVQFGGHSVSATADAVGNWSVRLPSSKANTNAQDLVVSGRNTVTIKDVLVGDVWLCSGQSNMAMGLGGCDRPEDIRSADFPGIRAFQVPMAPSATPTRALSGNWDLCSPQTASRFSAVAFYFARETYLSQKRGIPVGIIVSSVGGTRIDVWLAPEGAIGMPLLAPLFQQPVLPSGPFSLFNGMIYPLAPFALNGILWYQGENTEVTRQSADSYFLKMKALARGWSALFGTGDDLPFYFVQIANWGPVPNSSTPDMSIDQGWNADSRLQQANAMSIPRAGMASAIDIGEPGDWHPKDKLDLGERLALWALKNNYGQSKLVTSGPVLRDVSVSGETVVCSFDHVGAGLMVGLKTPYQPTREVPGGALQRFVIAGVDGIWNPADAVIRENRVVLSSPAVAAPRKVSYACWQNPEGCNLYNKEGLPASPFYVDDVTVHYLINASAGQGGKITPSGPGKFLKRMTALYRIAPEPGFYIQDVKVDGLSVGSIPSYTFDPVYANHAIEASFARKAPRYTISTSSNGGGSLAPSGAVTVEQGHSITFNVLPNAGNRVALTIDGMPLGPRDSFTFSNVRSNHTIAASFSCTLVASAGFGGGIAPAGSGVSPYNGNQSFTITPLPGYAVASVVVDGKDVGAVPTYEFRNVTASHTISAKFKGTLDNGVATGSIPRRDQLLFACLGESLPASPSLTAWPALIPEGKQFSAIGSPTMERVEGRNYARFDSLEADGFSVGNYPAPIPCEGATIVAVARPVRNGVGAGWVSIVDVFYDRLVLGIRNDSGAVCVRCNGTMQSSDTPIPDGQLTILSLVVQPGGAYKVYANGAEIMSNSSSSAMTALVPGVAGGFAHSITLGRNAPDAWTAYNGNIGDLFFYKAALTDQERRELEKYIADKL